MNRKIILVIIFLLCLILGFIFICLHPSEEKPSGETGGAGVGDNIDADEKDEVVVEDEVDMSMLEYDEQDESVHASSAESEDKNTQSTNSQDNEKTDETDDEEKTENIEDTENNTIPDKQRYDKDGDGFVDGWY